ncbi:MAG: hypothetical protein AAFY28_09865, partial [Actinomycetota bacterium]
MSEIVFVASLGNGATASGGMAAMVPGGPSVVLVGADVGTSDVAVDPVESVVLQPATIVRRRWRAPAVAAVAATGVIVA